MIEVNDMAALYALRGRPHVVGPFMNVYNEATLRVLEGMSTNTVCLPPELPGPSIRTIAANRRTAQIEVFAFGRAPLAVSARCYHARIHNLTKDGCRYVCEQDRDGLDVDTLDGQNFLAINGIATMASGVTVLGEEVRLLGEAGVSRIRLSPQTCDMVAVAKAYRNLIDGLIDGPELLAAIASQPLPGAIVNGYVHGVGGCALKREDRCYRRERLVLFIVLVKVLVIVSRAPAPASPPSSCRRRLLSKADNSESPGEPSALHDISRRLLTGLKAPLLSVNPDKVNPAARGEPNL